MSGRSHFTVLILLIPLAFAQSAQAQSWSANVDLLFYGDNTEFGNPFRDGETLLGTAGRLYLDVTLSDAATLRGGIFAKGRYGAHEFVEEAEPMIALVLKRGASRFIFGSLETATFERSRTAAAPRASAAPSVARSRAVRGPTRLRQGYDGAAEASAQAARSALRPPVVRGPKGPRYKYLFLSASSAALSVLSVANPHAVRGPKGPRYKSVSSSASSAGLSSSSVAAAQSPAPSQFRGPDADTPHGLLPPLQREQLVFERAHEMGIQWRHESPRVDHDSWINWQRLNTSAHRERFDAGVRTRVAFGDNLAAHGQWHVVHEGGQQHEVGPVRDSQAAAAGLEWSHAIGASRLVLDGYGVISRWVPDREDLDRAETGGGIFARGVLYRASWRGHLIVWRGRHMLKEEGDANYLMARRDGTFHRKVRDYAELGITRSFQPAPTVEFDASARLHRVESQYEYSYRLLARVFLRYPR